MFDCFLPFLMQESLVQDKLCAHGRGWRCTPPANYYTVVQVLQICKKQEVLYSFLKVV